MVRATLLAFALTAWCGVANAETPDEWVSLGTRVHGGFGAFIPLGIKIGLDAVQRLNTKRASYLFSITIATRRRVLASPMALQSPPMRRWGSAPRPSRPRKRRQAMPP